MKKLDIFNIYYEQITEYMYKITFECYGCPDVIETITFSEYINTNRNIIRDFKMQFSMHYPEKIQAATIKKVCSLFSAVSASFPTDSKNLDKVVKESSVRCYKEAVLSLDKLFGEILMKLEEYKKQGKKQAKELKIALMPNDYVVKRGMFRQNITIKSENKNILNSILKEYESIYNLILTSHGDYNKIFFDNGSYIGYNTPKNEESEIISSMPNELRKLLSNKKIKVLTLNACFTGGVKNSGLEASLAYHISKAFPYVVVIAPTDYDINALEDKEFSYLIDELKRTLNIVYDFYNLPVFEDLKTFPNRAIYFTVIKNNTKETMIVK